MLIQKHILLSNSAASAVKTPNYSGDALDCGDDLVFDCRVDLRVGVIKKAWRHPEADSLYVEEVEVGEATPRQVRLLYSCFMVLCFDNVMLRCAMLCWYVPALCCVYTPFSAMPCCAVMCCVVWHACYARRRTQNKCPLTHSHPDKAEQ